MPFSGACLRPTISTTSSSTKAASGSRKRFNVRRAPAVRLAGSARTQRQPRALRRQSALAPADHRSDAADGHDQRAEPDEADQRAILQAQAPGAGADVIARARPADRGCSAGAIAAVVCTVPCTQ